MLRTCKCGETLDIRLRTVIYSHTVEVDNVPIYSCSSCYHTQVLPEVKSDLTRLISELGRRPAKQRLNFIDCNEWAYLIAKAADRDMMHISIQSIIVDRVDQLLDMLLLARSLNDNSWEKELTARLSQLTKNVMAS